MAFWSLSFQRILEHLIYHWRDYNICRKGNRPIDKLWSVWTRRWIRWCRLRVWQWVQWSKVLWNMVNWWTRLLLRRIWLQWRRYGSFWNYLHLQLLYRGIKVWIMHGKKPMGQYRSIKPKCNPPHGCRCGIILCHLRKI